MMVTGRMLMAIFIVGLLFAIHLQPVLAQPAARIGGRVFDRQTLESLPGATVIFAEGRGVATDDTGHYHFELPAGNYLITFQYVGYRSVTRQLSAVSGGEYRLDIGLEPYVTEIEQVVVSAGRVEQRLSELTVSMSIIRPEAISSSHITNAQELMNKSSGIEVLDGQASIRGGSGFSYGAGSRVMVLIDGLPMLSADAGHVRWSSLPLENLSQVEVIKGASSVLYGSSALNGIINFRTAEATRAGRTAFHAETGVFGKPGNKDWIWWDSPRMFSNMSLSHIKRMGNTDVSLGGFFLHDNGYRKLNDNTMGRLNMRLKHRCTQVSGLIYGLAMNGTIARKMDFILWEDAHAGALKQQISTAQQLTGSNFHIDPFLSLNTGGKVSHELKTRIQFSSNKFPDGGQNNSDARSVYSEYLLGFVSSEVLSINTGLTQYASSITSNFYGDHRAWNGAIFSQADVTPHDKLKLVAGLRVEYNTLDGQADKLVPLLRTGINYRLFDLTFIRASYGQGYRYPSIAEKHAATTLGAVKIFPNPAVGPESGWNSEIGVKQGVWSDHFEGLIDLAVFYSQNKDMIEYVFGIHSDPFSDQFGLGFKSTNIEHSRVYGFELEFLLNTQPRLLNYTINGGYVFMYPIEFNPVTNKNTGKHLKFRRKHAFNLNVTTSYRAFEFGLHAYARSKILDIDDVFLNPGTREDILPGFYDYWTENNAGHFLADFSVGYKIGMHYKLSLAVKNLTNTEYMGRPGDIQPHRHLSVRFSGVF